MSDAKVETQYRKSKAVESKSSSSNSEVESKSESECDNGEMKHGQRLLDDLMNTFCDKLQKVAPQEIEGMLAIQFVLMAAKQGTRTWRDLWCLKRFFGIDPAHVSSMITGKKNAIQVVYDHDRVHYVVLYYNKERHSLTLYDSLVRRNKYEKEFTVPLFKQVQILFGHLFEDRKIRLFVETDFERQPDDWSCGYRAIACIMDLVRNEDPCRLSCDTEAVLRFINLVINEKNLTWNTFEKVSLGKPRDRSFHRPAEVFVFEDFTYLQISEPKTLSVSEYSSDAESKDSDPDLTDIHSRLDALRSDIASDKTRSAVSEENTRSGSLSSQRTTKSRDPSL